MRYEYKTENMPTSCADQLAKAACAAYNETCGMV